MALVWFSPLTWLGLARVTPERFRNVFDSLYPHSRNKHLYQRKRKAN